MGISAAERSVSGLNDQEGGDMLAALGLGVIGTIIVLIIVIAVIMFFVRRA